MVELGHGYLRTAIKDLKAAKILYRNGLYPQAVFYFAQSIEKANKSLLLVTGHFTEDYLANKVRHDSTKLYEIIAIEQRKQHSKMLENLDNYPELNNFSVLERETINERIMASNDGLREIARIRKGKEDFANLSTREINNILKVIYSELQQIENEIEELSANKIDVEFWIEEIDSTIRKMRLDNTERSNYLADELEKLKVSNLEDLWRPIKEQLPAITQGYAALIPLYYLTPVLLPHVNPTRYPEKRKSPVSIYNYNMPLVKKLPELFELHSNTLKNLKLYRDQI